MPASIAIRFAGTVANGRFGPDLTHLMSRDTIGAGTLPNTRGRSREMDQGSRRIQARLSDACYEVERPGRKPGRVPILVTACTDQFEAGEFILWPIRSLFQE